MVKITWKHLSSLFFFSRSFIERTAHIIHTQKVKDDSAGGRDLGVNCRRFVTTASVGRRWPAPRRPPCGAWWTLCECRQRDCYCAFSVGCRWHSESDRCSPSPAGCRVPIPRCWCTSDWAFRPLRPPGTAVHQDLDRILRVLSNGQDPWWASRNRARASKNNPPE